jgi:hypothetical protein
MTGLAMVNDAGAETILLVLDEIKRLGGQFSLRDAARIEDHIQQKYKPKMDGPKKDGPKKRKPKKRKPKKSVDPFD